MQVVTKKVWETRAFQCSSAGREGCSASQLLRISPFFGELRGLVLPFRTNATPGLRDSEIGGGSRKAFETSLEVLHAMVERVACSRLRTPQRSGKTKACAHIQEYIYALGLTVLCVVRRSLQKRSIVLSNCASTTKGTPHTAYTRSIPGDTDPRLVSSNAERSVALSWDMHMGWESCCVLGVPIPLGRELSLSQRSELALGSSFMVARRAGRIHVSPDTRQRAKFPLTPCSRRAPLKPLIHPSAQ